MISYLLLDQSRTFLKGIYIRVNFHKGIFEIISPFKSLNLFCWNSILEYLVWGSETAERLVLINILRDSLDIQGIVN